MLYSQCILSLDAWPTFVPSQHLIPLGVLWRARITLVFDLSIKWIRPWNECGRSHSHSNDDELSSTVWCWGLWSLLQMCVIRFCGLQWCVCLRAKNGSWICVCMCPNPTTSSSALVLGKSTNTLISYQVLHFAVSLLECLNMCCSWSVMCSCQWDPSFHALLLRLVIGVEVSLLLWINVIECDEKMIHNY